MMTLRRLFSLLGILGVLGLAPMLSACNTMEGMGKDVSAAGDAVSDTAQETKQGM
jgi:predicted small secreted protein